MEQMLWEAACSIRGEKDAAKFKDYLLPLLFLKRWAVPCRVRAALRATRVLTVYGALGDSSDNHFEMHIVCLFKLIDVLFG